MPATTQTSIGNENFTTAIQNPGGDGAFGVFLHFALIIGMLYVTFKASSTFANQAAGFNWAAMIPREIAGGVLGGAGRLGGFMFRNTGLGGQRVAQESERFAARAKAARLQGGMLNNLKAAWLDARSQGMKRRVASEGNITNASAFKAVLGDTALGKAAATKGGGWQGRADARAKAALEKAKRETIDKDKVKELMDTAKKSVTPAVVGRNADVQAAKAKVDAHDTDNKALQEIKALGANIKDLSSKQSDLQRQREELQKQIDATSNGVDKDKLKEAHANVETSIKNVTAAITTKAGEMADKQNEVASTSNTIKEARDQAIVRSGDQKQFEELLQRRLGERDKFNDALTAVTDRVTSELVGQQLEKTAPELARAITRHVIRRGADGRAVRTKIYETDKGEGEVRDIMVSNLAQDLSEVASAVGLGSYRTVEKTGTIKYDGGEESVTEVSRVNIAGSTRAIAAKAAGTDVKNRNVEDIVKALTPLVKAEQDAKAANDDKPAPAKKAA